MEELKNKCISCKSFKNGHIKKGMGFCVGNYGAFKEIFGMDFNSKKEKEPLFLVNKMDKCSFWEEIP